MIHIIILQYILSKTPKNGHNTLLVEKFDQFDQRRIPADFSRIFDPPPIKAGRIWGESRTQKWLKLAR